MKEKLTRLISKLLTIVILLLSFCILSALFSLLSRGSASLFGFRFYYVATDSMAPTIQPGSLVLVREQPADTLEVGDIITFFSTDPAIYGLPNTHRIQAVEETPQGRRFITQGDHNPRPDDYTVPAENVIGRVIAHTQPITPLATFFRFAVTKQGFFVCVVMPLLVISMMVLNNFIHTFRRSLSDEGVLMELAAAPDAESRRLAREILEALAGKPADQLTEQDIERLMRQCRGEIEHDVSYPKNE